MKNLKLQNSTLVVVVDDNIYDELNTYKWYLSKNKGSVYKYDGSVSLCGIKSIYSRSLSNQIFGTQELFYDHKDRNFLNYSKDNLRVCTFAQNAYNRTKSPNCTSVYKGVCVRNGKWIAAIKHKRKSIYLGTFIDEILAAKAYDKKASELFGEFANLNFKLEEGNLL